MSAVSPRSCTTLLGTFIATVVLSGCAVGPAYRPPAVDMPVSYKGAGSEPATAVATRPQPAAEAAAAGWNKAQPDDAASRGAWWERFGDAGLNQLEQRADTSNQNVQAALAQLRQARAIVDATHAAFFPTVTAGASAQQFLTSDTVLGRSLAGRTVPDYAIPVSATWEPDLWNRIGNSEQAARAGAEASAADLEGVRLGMQAELATDYFNLRGLDAEKRLLDAAIVAYQQAFDMTSNRFNVGIASGSDVAQATLQLETTQAQDIDLGVARAQLEHAIATLIGQPASAFSLAPDNAALVPPPIPLGLPSQLLQRRPDIAAAERRMAAANAQVGVAQAAFYPDLMIAATGGLESSRLATLFTAPSLFWALGPQLVGTLFDGGRRSAGVRQARAQYDANVAGYRQTVLSGIQEVEDDLSSVRLLEQEALKQDQAAQAAEQAEQLALNRYRTGTAAYLEVVIEQTAALSSERSQIEIRRRQLQASVSLVRALGGNWSQT